MKAERPVAVIGAIAANGAIAVTKFIAAAITGSSAMASEGIHSLVDTGNELLLLLGIHRSKRPAHTLHPFGHGQEIYFWALIVAIVLFGAGGGMSIYEGVGHLFHPEAPTDLLWNYVVLGLAFLFEGISFFIAWRELKKRRHERGFWNILRRSRDPSLFVVLLEDTADLAGIVVAGVGILLTQVLGSAVYDAIAAIVIGAILAAVAVYLINQTRRLLLGEGVGEETRQSICALVEKEPMVERVVDQSTLYLGPRSVLLTLRVQFQRERTVEDFAETTRKLKHDIQHRFPQIHYIFIEADSISR